MRETNKTTYGMVFFKLEVDQIIINLMKIRERKMENNRNMTLRANKPIWN